MLVLGIDPGTATTGYGLLKINKLSARSSSQNGIYEAVAYGLIETDKNGDPGKRLREIHHQMTKLFVAFSPDVVAIERLFFATNAKTAMRVGQALGVMIFCAAQHDVTVVEYAPGTIKKNVAGSGRADKKEIQRSIRKVLGAKVRSRKGKRTHFDNSADALAVALCHAYSLVEERNN